jgi:deoxyribodipyrimidine photo-lyase
MTGDCNTHFPQNTVLVWYRTDLRLHDHVPLHQALQSGSLVIPVYCIDPRQFGKTSFGFPKTGAFRTQFLLESLSDLRQNLRRLGSDLVIRQGFPELELPALAKQLNAHAVYYHQEATAEEVQVASKLHQEMSELGVKMHSVWGHTLYHPDDLPFHLSRVPEVFTQFRKAVEKESSINPPRPAPTSLPALPNLDSGELPTLDSLGLEPPPHDPRGVLLFRGGETAAMERLQDYFWDQDCLKVYKKTRNGMVGANYSSKFSPWLALGCLSPRNVAEQVQQYETQRISNDSTYWLMFELLWRDYFRYICVKHGNAVFQSAGLQGVEIPWKVDWELGDRWCQGMTGFPLVDANMRELAATGFMSNRGRQNVASFLTKNLGIDWRFGAEWFESLLIDYDVCSNYGNWNYTAGVGNDARGFRFFNILKQSRDYDPEGEYVKHWLPELARVPASKIHTPWMLLPVEQERFSVCIGTDYPQPMVDLFQSAKENEQRYNVALGKGKSTRPGQKR